MQMDPREQNSGLFCLSLSHYSTPPFFYTTQGRHHVLPKARINRSNPVCLSSPSPRKFFSTEPAMPSASSWSRLESCSTGWMTAPGHSRELHPRLAPMSQHCHVSSTVSNFFHLNTGQNIVDICAP
ncbi:hypothetical protein L798_07800 [Zootermopsis nevadensis]|uniref:Uncharacterized protein n=1 Tax=Zootermopsis nevadensis TaxID=136037 RepID=A0A067R783_ZOONE|nr:hypothetical protein L798_07800 [Zootermopsis nevadensis]